MTAGQAEKVRVGDVRPSQLMYAFGIGSVVDLPHFSAMVMGLDDWDQARCRPILDDRLLDAVRFELGPQVDSLNAPPQVDPPAVGLQPTFDESRRVGVPAATFPRWFRCPACRLLTSLSSGLITLKTNPFRADRVQYVHENCPKGGAMKPVVIPARFLVACENGHIDDFPWVTYVHGGPTNCPARLRLSETGATGEAAAVWVTCEVCDARIQMSHAFSQDGKPWTTPCTGRRPQLRDYVEQCDVTAKPLLLGASNAWFPLSLSALSIPGTKDRLAQLVGERWDTLRPIDSIGVLAYLRTVGQLGDLAAYSDDEIMGAIESRRTDVPTEEAGHENLRIPEWQTFVSDEQPASPDFCLRRVAVPAGFEGQIAQVALVERLREVQALVGFTRLESPGDFSERVEVPFERRGPLARGAPTWVPAAEVRGEGIFIRFSEAAIQRWVRQPAALLRAVNFSRAHEQWARMRGLPAGSSSFLGMRYVLLHSFAHALMRQLALECGYAATSIRERLYVAEPRDRGGPMAGVLLYTSAPDSEGTLGGLVSLGEPERLGYYINQALLTAQMCASDPLCAEHLPEDTATTVDAAACHACLFVPETSCERGNRYLDRAALVSTVAGQTGQGMAFFAGN